MKFIIFVAGNIRNGQRVGLPDFPYSEAHGKYIYQNRELEFDEFNDIAVRVFNPNYHTNEFTLCPLLVAVEAAVLAPLVDEAISLDFRLEGKSIYLGDDRVAGLYGDEKHLRVFKEDLRPQIEAWLQIQS